MYKFIFVFSFFVFISLPACAGLHELATQKTSNYKFLSVHYNLLLKNIEQRNYSDFCSAVKDSYVDLVNIFYKDFDFIKELREENYEEYQSYAKHIEENSSSPLFSYNAYLSTCSKGDFNSESLIFSTKNNITNINFLALLHNQWRAAYGF